MGGLVGSVYDLINGDPAARQENQLSQIGGFEQGTGQGLTTAGAKFEEDILSGDPTKIASALTPEISAGQGMVQQARNENAQFAPRSGGTAASTAGAEAENRGNIINLAGGLQKGAADSALNSGGNLLNQASGNISDVAGMKTARRAKDVNSVGQIGQAVAEAATMGMGGMGAPMGEMAPQLTSLAPEMGEAPGGWLSGAGMEVAPDLSAFA